MSIVERQKKVVEEFSRLPNWEDKYRRIIDLGKSLPSFPEELKIEQLKVKGCQSQVWLKAERASNGQVIFTGDSDAVLVRGLLALILGVFSGSQPKEILEAPLDFLSELGLDTQLSPSRSNGLFAMIKQMRLYAQAFILMERA